MLFSFDADPRVLKILSNPMRQGDQDLFAPIVCRISDEISESTVTALSMALERAGSLGQTVLPLIIDSYGGDVYAELAMVDIIDSSSIPVATIVVGKAMSAAATISACGTPGYRFVSSNSTIMLHDASSELAGKTEDISNAAEEVERICALGFERLDRASGKKKGTFAKLVRGKGTDWYIAPEEAIALGLADKIGIPVFQAKLEMTQELVIVEKSPRPKKR